MTVELLGCSGSSESTLVKLPHCWKSHAAAHFKMSFIGAILPIFNLHVALRWLSPTYGSGEAVNNGKS